METYPLGLAVFDFVPVSVFLVGAFFLVRSVRLLRNTACSRMVMAASLLIFSGGFLKALWKILFTVNVGDYRWMSEVQFMLVAPGFFALLVAVILTSRVGSRSEAKGILMPAIAGWKVPLLIVMTLSSMGAQGILAYIAFQRKVRLAAAGFIMAFLCLVAMGALASGTQTVARQWLEESINTVGQIGFVLGSFLLYRHLRAASTDRRCV